MMNFAKRMTSALCAVFIMMLGCITFFAADSGRLTDDADLFTQSEQEEIVKMLSDGSEQTGWDMIIYTNLNGVDEYDIENYTNRYYDRMGYGLGDNKSGLILNIDMESRQMYVITKGDTMYYIDDRRLDRMLDDIQSDLRSGDYFDAADDFISSAVRYYSDGKPENGTYDNVYINEKADHPVTYSLFHYGIPSLVAGVVIALITVLVISFRYKNNGKENVYNLHENSKANITVSNDIFLTKSVSVSTISSDSGSSSGSGGSSHSSSGTSHGGGGRGF